MNELFSPSIAHQLNYYVYIYIDPRDESVFYVGKGKGNRAFNHLSDERTSRKGKRIQEIREAGKQPRIEILVHGLEDEATALRIEASIIDLLGKDKLTNEVHGYHSRSHGRMQLDQIRALYGADEVHITEPTILIRINQMYRHTMTPIELYEATRGAWVIGPNRNRAKYAFAVYEGIVREVYQIQGWFPCGSTEMFTRHYAIEDDPRRWEFVGRIANPGVRNKYVYRSVAHYYPKPSQNPITYVNVE
jgi:hypothetical protein